MLITALDLIQNPCLLEDAGSFRLVGGGHRWVDAQRAGRLVKLTRIADTQAGPKVREYYVNPNQPVTLSVSHVR
jgi:hypothetical protein